MSASSLDHLFRKDEHVIRSFSRTLMLVETIGLLLMQRAGFLKLDSISAVMIRVDGLLVAVALPFVWIEKRNNKAIKLLNSLICTLQFFAFMACGEVFDHVFRFQKGHPPFYRGLIGVLGPVLLFVLEIDFVSRNGLWNSLFYPDSGNLSANAACAKTEPVAAICSNCARAAENLEVFNKVASEMVFGSHYLKYLATEHELVSA